MVCTEHNRNNMKKILRNLFILGAFVIVLIFASCSTQKQLSAPSAPPPSYEDLRPLRICKEFESDGKCKKLGPTATGADRGVQEEKELP